MSIYTCSNPTEHPTLHTINRHHNPPKSWTSDNGASSKVIPLCGTCHDEAHTLMNEYVRNKGLPSWEVRRTYSRFVARLAAEAWARRPLDRPIPYTTAAP